MAGATANPVNRPKRVQKFNRRGERGGKFRIIDGIHVDDGPPGCQCDSCLDGKQEEHVYEGYDCYCRRMRQEGRGDEILSPQDYKNDLIDSQKRDLCGRFNTDPSNPATHKFERLAWEDGSPANAAFAAAQRYAPPPVAFPVEKMSFAQLLTYAAEQGIDIKNAGKKEDILKLIREAQGKAGQEAPAGK